MTFKEKLKWIGLKPTRLEVVRKTQEEIESGKAQKVTYYWFVDKTISYAVEVYLEGNLTVASAAAKMVVQAVIQYFYGDWRNNLQTPDGKIGQEAWRSVCLWYEELMESLPFAAALSDWDTVARIASYPPQNKLPEPAKARGETAWGWALITFLRSEPRAKIEAFLKKAEDDKSKRPKMLCPVRRALMDNDAAQFEKTLLAYLTYYRKSEFKLHIKKLLSLDGTTLYHLGRKQGFHVKLPENVADHVIRFE